VAYNIAQYWTEMIAVYVEKEYNMT